MNELEKEGRVRRFSDEETTQMRVEMQDAQEEFDRDFILRQHRSVEEARRIVFNA